MKPLPAPDHSARWAPDGQRNACRRQDGRRRALAPCVAVAHVRRDINLAHPRVEAGDNEAALAIPIDFLGERSERRHGHDGQIGTERQPLCDAAADAHARKRSGTRTECDSVDVAERAASFVQRFVDHDQQSLRVSLPDVLVAAVPTRTVADGHATPIGRRIERQ